jgi:trans-aconitate 2-methyltransferase
MPWNPDLYHEFQEERFAPFDDLLKLVHRRKGMRVIDLGCGTGELTHRLANYLPESDVVGIDSSEEMLSRAEALSQPGLKFEKQAIEDVYGDWDLVFSHAAIQWVDDHERLVPKLLSLAADGGQLAVQLPSNHNHPSHMIMRRIAGEEPFLSALDGWIRIPTVLDVVRYAELLHESGGGSLNVFEKVFPHVLRDSDDVVSWMSGTALIPFIERLPEELRDEFIARYRKRLKELWPTSPVFYGFRRIFFSASKRQPIVEG